MNVSSKIIDAVMSPIQFSCPSYQARHCIRSHCSKYVFLVAWLYHDCNIDHLEFNRRLGPLHSSSRKAMSYCPNLCRVSQHRYTVNQNIVHAGRSCCTDPGNDRVWPWCQDRVYLIQLCFTFPVWRRRTVPRKLFMSYLFATVGNE